MYTDHSGIIMGRECGRIIYESSVPKLFFPGGSEIKGRHARQGAGAVIVTHHAREMIVSAKKNGVWICSFAEVKRFPMC